jgi:GNAT superfamily N-acetyltransferase
VAVLVRDATPDDAGAIGRIKRDGWRAAYRGLLPDAVLDALDAEQLATDFASGIRELGTEDPTTRAFLVAERAGVVVGYVVLGPYRWDELPGAGEVYAIYVDPPCWGGGAGRALMAAAETRLRRLGHREAALWVLEGNRVGMGFYESVGWHADGAHGERCEVEGAPEVRYRRSLTP